MIRPRAKPVAFRCLDCRTVAPFKPVCAFCGSGAFEARHSLARMVLRFTQAAPLSFLETTLRTLTAGDAWYFAANANQEPARPACAAFSRRARALIDEGAALAQASRKAIAESFRLLRFMP